MDKRRQGRRGLIAAGLATLACTLGLSGIATAGPDQLKGGSVVIQLQNARGLKLKPKSLNLPIASGSVDPISGAGTVQVNGAFRAKRGKGKAKVKITRLSLGANGGPGSIAAKVGKSNVGSFATLSGGTVARNGFGATISNITAKIAGKGAQALNRAFSPTKGKGAKKSAGGRVKAGQPLGTIVSITTDPLAVEVVPGTGTLTLHTDLGGAFASKLPQHCIEPLSGGVAPDSPGHAVRGRLHVPGLRRLGRARLQRGRGGDRRWSDAEQEQHPARHPHAVLLPLRGASERDEPGQHRDRR